MTKAKVWTRWILTVGICALPLTVTAAKKNKKKARPPVARTSVSSKNKGQNQTRSNKSQGKDGRSSSRDMDLTRNAVNLPSSMRLQVPTRDMETVKPPRSNEFYEGASAKEKEYENLVDQEIRSLYTLSEQYRRSRSRGEIWLRLAERYVEKAQIIEFRLQSAYDKQSKDADKNRSKSRVDLRLAREYNRKAVQLYEWFVRDFPDDKKVDQALFFLGYNNFELGQPKKGEEYYLRLVRDFPDSVYVIESYFALGEYYFENEKWQQAFDNYNRVVASRKARLNTFALYKSAWSLYRLNRVRIALQTLEKVIKMSRQSEAQEAAAPGRKAVNRLRLGAEALKDYVPFYAEVGDFREARAEFQRVAQSEALAYKMLEKLAYTFLDAGNRPAANFVFKQLISLNPLAERAADYQYQVILAYATSDPRSFKKELEIWLDQFGAASKWATANAKNAKLLEDTLKLQETTVRNHVLQLHQTAQNSRATFSQQAAHEAYLQYFRYFLDSAQAPEMKFFHAELLFDMRRFEEAARDYQWVVEKDPQGKYAEMATINTLLALEKDLPTPKQIEEKRGTSLNPIALDASVQRFEKAALKYMQDRPKGEKISDIRRRLGVLYYSYNHFDQAITLFEQILSNDPKSENAEIAGNLILDIYKLRNDMAGFADKGKQFLADPKIANTKFGQEVRSLMERATFLRAEKFSEGKRYGDSAKEFEEFSRNYKSSDLVLPARYKAAYNYEKAGDIGSALRMHALVLGTPARDAKAQNIHNDSRNALARLYQQTGQLELAARQYQTFAQANRKDAKGMNAFFNAGVLYDALGNTNSAIQNYDEYYATNKKSDRFEALYLDAEILRKRSRLRRAAPLYERYINEGGRNHEHLAAASFWLAKEAQQSQKDGPARKWFQRCMDYHRTARKNAESVRYAAESRFELAQGTLFELRIIKFGRSDKTQAAAAGQIKMLRERYIKYMKDVIRYDYGPMIIAALSSTGKMFEQIARLFERVPTPAGIAGEDEKRFKELLQGQANGVRVEAKNSFKAAYDKSLELETYTEWSEIARRSLAQLDPANYSWTGEQVVNTNAGDWMGL